MKYFALLLSALIGCSSSSAAPSPNGGFECDRYTSSACETNVLCAISDYGTCVEQLKASGVVCASPPWSTATVDPALTDACLKAIHALTCAEVKDPKTPLPAACMTWASQYKGQ